MWLTPSGEEMTDSDWRTGYAKSVAVYLNGAAITEPDPRGDPVTDDRFLLMFNAGDEAITFTLPDARLGTTWEIVIDTTSPVGESDAAPLVAKSEVELSGHAVMILRSQE